MVDKRLDKMDRMLKSRKEMVLKWLDFPSFVYKTDKTVFYNNDNFVFMCD